MNHSKLWLVTLLAALVACVTGFVQTKPEQKELKKTLTPMQYKVTQEDGTEPPFRNKYWDNKKPGIYVDIISGEPLFSSTDKFKSGTGWPSFVRPLEDKNIVRKDDFKLMSRRIEVRSKGADSHLGHVFNDGPKPTGKRYCINSAALRFIPVESLEKEGYGKYLKLFPKEKSSVKEERAIFAGGCFWCMEEPFDKIKGVKSTVSGYAGGKEKYPTYKQVASGATSHTEVVEVTYDPSQVTYEELLKVFWQNVDPQAKDRQFCDAGTQYRHGILYINADQKKKAAASIARLRKKTGWKNFYTTLEDGSQFWPAEDYHQDYYKKNPVRFKYYKFRCGRDQRLEDLNMKQYL